MTNGDYIRKMTDEELARTIMCPDELVDEEIHCIKYNPNDRDWNCIKCSLAWLKEERKND